MNRVRELLRAEDGGASRSLGGLLLAIAVLVLLFRRTSLGDPWGPLPVFLVLLATTVVLYGAGVAGARLAGTTHPWQILFAVVGSVFVPLTLYAFLDWVGGNPNAPLNTAWIFLLTAVAAFAAAFLARVRVACLLGALALIVAWLGLWGELLEDGLGADAGTLRGLLVLAAVIVLVAGATLGRFGLPEGGFADMVTAAGLAAVAAGAISLIALGDVLFFFAEPEVEASLFWDAWLLLVTLALLIYGALARIRGPAYVGALGLIAFTYLVGLDADDPTPSGSLLGWPLVLVAALALLVLSALPVLRRTRGNPGG
ncbi:MAG: hypothetical protein ACRDLO_11340 [Solirubrobacterales bacterium]